MVKLINSFLNSLQLGKNPIFICGHGRSGTTWIAKTIKEGNEVLYYNEPCNPNSRKGEYSTWFKYVRKGENFKFFEERLDACFRGLIIGGAKSWITKKAYRRLIPNYRIVIKDIATFMSLEWVYIKYRPLILILMRHPCAVALSERNQNTPYKNAIKFLINQSNLTEDHLKDYVYVMESAKKPLEIYSAVWGARIKILANLIGRYPEWKIIHYENICDDPLNSFYEIFCQYDLKWSQNIKNFIIKTTTKELPGLYSISKLSNKQIYKWKEDMSTNEIDQVRNIVERFELPFYNKESDWI